ncbi:MAG TPA: ABC transporter permease subunit [Thermoanaerobaculia bacterium]|nr:ABC transporter permease subunit [Thermoanaerobaculia bacterium]
MRVLAANIEDVMREAAARWTLVAYFFISTLFIIIFASAINLDIVDGALAGAQLFGKEFDMNDSMSIEKLVLGFESGFSVFLYIICTFTAVFATAHLVPRMQDKGTVDLYLSRPVGRVQLLLSRYVAGMILAASNIIYLIGSVWLIVIWKTGVANGRFLMGGVIIFLMIAVLLAFAFLVGVITSSTAVSIMTTFAIFLFGALMAGHEKFSAAVSTEWQSWIIESLYWIFPKSAEMGRTVFAFVGGAKLTEGAVSIASPSAFITTAAFGIACLTLASWLFTRKEF